VESKALKLRDRLRDADFSAFVERATKPNGDAVYRVRVGPVLVRSEANKLKDKVKQEIKLDGLVMKYR
jgi:DedD protein